MFARLSGVTIASLWLAMAGVPARSAIVFYPHHINSAPPQGSALRIAQTPTTPEAPKSPESETPTPPEAPKPPESETPTPPEAPKPPESETPTPPEAPKPPESETPTPPEAPKPPESETPAPPEAPKPPESETPTPPEAPKPPESETPTPPEAPKPPESAVSPGNWQAFTAPQGRFSIDFPGVPNEQVEPADVATRRLETGAYIWESTNSPLGYGAFYKVFNGTPTNEQARTFLDRFLEDFVANGVVSGKLLSNRAIAINNYLGREIEVEGAEGYIKARMYLVENRLYLLTAVAPSKTTYPQDGDRFFDSFKLR
ncbi:hypothetical protein [Oscillatoria sp. FACHB-1406]|uniref:hypothetical protein n=1 Tax=Oscillatoria sp. FACHB-1406 TaxID=2692846 RepID=UPI001682F63D|nr:hypothetical protein [Oscillatoria sp. FACHB-1406]MBD2579841.1 hypothetical protein [Oscillatoria sp. FACHB-1406]